MSPRLLFSPSRRVFTDPVPYVSKALSPTPSETSRRPSPRIPTIPISIIIEDKVRFALSALSFTTILIVHFIASPAVYFIAGDLQKAMDDYAKSTELDSTFIFSHIQRAVTQFRLEKIPMAMSSFRNILKQFPDRSEGYNY